MTEECPSHLVEKWLSKFLQKYDLGLICRAYKVVEDWV